MHITYDRVLLSLHLKLLNNQTLEHNNCDKMGGYEDRRGARKARNT